MSLALGTTLCHYDVTALIGEGGISCPRRFEILTLDLDRLVTVTRVLSAGQQVRQFSVQHAPLRAESVITSLISIGGLCQRVAVSTGDGALTIRGLRIPLLLPDG